MVVSSWFPSCLWRIKERKEHGEVHKIMNESRNANGEVHFASEKREAGGAELICSPKKSLKSLMPNVTIDRNQNFRNEPYTLPIGRVVLIRGICKQQQQSKQQQPATATAKSASHTIPSVV